MTKPRIRILQDIQFHGYSQRMQELYLRTACQLAEH